MYRIDRIEKIVLCADGGEIPLEIGEKLYEDLIAEQLPNVIQHDIETVFTELANEET